MKMKIIIRSRNETKEQYFVQNCKISYATLMLDRTVQLMKSLMKETDLKNQRV